jgi:RNA polymerase sigma factor (sigma-70 family)
VATNRASSIGRDFLTLFEAGSFAGLTDGQLLERFQDSRGEMAEHAFAALIERHGPMVLRTCQRILRDEHDAHDAFQATFLVLVRKSRSVWVHESLGPWLHRVACRAANRVRSARARRQKVERTLAVVAPDRDSADAPSELVAVLHEELDRLPAHYRAAIVLCDLEGHSCEQTARQLGCPIGTVGSRLTRGREKLRERLIRRGFAPGAGMVATALARDAALGSVPSSLAGLTARAAMQLSAQASSGPLTIASAIMAREISRSMLMTKVLSIASVALASFSLCMVTALSYRAAAGPRQADVQKVEKVQEPPRKQRAEKPSAEKPSGDFVNDPTRHKDFLLATIGNMRPLITTKRGPSFQSREAVLYKDGSVKLYPLDAYDPVCPPLRHTKPIREVTFLDAAKLLITTSEDSIKIWDGLSGALRKEITGQFIRPLLFNFNSPPSGFVTIDHEGRIVTTWDVSKLEAIGTFQPPGSTRLIGAGLSNDGKILATIAEDRSVTLWDAAQHKEFATLKSPSRLLETVFVDDQVKSWKRPVLQFHEHFWKVVQSELAPAEPGTKKTK